VTAQITNVEFVAFPIASNTVSCDELQLRLAETEELLATQEEEASVILAGLARSGDPDRAEHRKELAEEAHREAVRAAEHAAVLRERFAEAASRQAALAVARAARLRETLAS
jgi:hypothetical protein